MTEEKKTTQREALKEIERIMKNAGEGKKTIVIAIQDDGEKIKGAINLDQTNILQAAELVLRRLIEARPKNSIELPQMPDALKSLFGVLAPDKLLGDLSNKRIYRRLLFDLLRKEVE